MARLPYLDKSDLAPEKEDLLARNIALHRALVHSPHGVRAFGGLGQFIRYQSRLDPRLRQVGYLASAPYEWSHHVKDRPRLWRHGRRHPSPDCGDRGTLEPVAKLVLEAARETTNDLAIAQATFEALAAPLDNEHVVDLVVTISLYNAVVRLLGSLAIDIGPQYLKYLELFPLPAVTERV